MGAMIKLWTVYDSPDDYPGKVVAREFRICRKDGKVVTETVGEPVIGDSVLEVRSRLPSGLARLPREPADHPSVVETWL
jgi:hypothetical protein